MPHRPAQPLVTVSCHEDLTATDLVGRCLLQGDETVWQDGPLTRAARTGAVCVIDEFEALPGRCKKPIDV